MHAAHVWLAALTLTTLLAPKAAADTLHEADILDDYLAEHDLVPGTPNCARHDGTFGPPGREGTPTPAGNNGILIEHKRWHHENGMGLDPSPDDSDRYGDAFVYWHREFLGAYEAWRAANGHPPVPPWDPATPMPPEIAAEFPGRECAPGRNTDPGVHLPSWATLGGGADADPVFGYTQVCQFEDTNQFGKALAASYHVDVHRSMGGDVVLMQDPRDAWFWSYHKFLDGVTLEFERTCPVLGLDVASAPTATAGDGGARETPGPGPLLALVGVLCSAAVGVRRR